ncbi:MAG: HD-GYP domain-containing protein [Vulcanimicrobiaceae bacterium]
MSQTLDDNRRFVMERIAEAAEIHNDELTIRDRMVVARFVDDVISAIRSGESAALRSYVESLADERVLPDGYARKLASACASMLAEIHAHRVHDSCATEFFTLLATDATTWFAERRAAVASDASRRVQEPVERRDVIELLAVAMMNAFDPDIYVHGVGVARVAERIARAMGYPSSFVTFVGEAGLVHDIGKISVPLELLQKPGDLTASEWETMREHPAKGYEILSTIPGLYKHATVVRAHHEWVDGSGYPDRLSRNEIPIAARIIAVADAFDAMIAARPYRPAISIEETLTHLTEASGTHFDPEPVRALCALVRSNAQEFVQTQAV